MVFGSGCAVVSSVGSCIFSLRLTCFSLSAPSPPIRHHRGRVWVLKDASSFLSDDLPSGVVQRQACFLSFIIAFLFGRFFPRLPSSSFLGRSFFSFFLNFASALNFIFFLRVGKLVFRFHSLFILRSWPWCLVFAVIVPALAFRLVFSCFMTRVLDVVWARRGSPSLLCFSLSGASSSISLLTPCGLSSPWPWGGCICSLSG